MTKYTARSVFSGYEVDNALTLQRLAQIMTPDDFTTPTLISDFLAEQFLAKQCRRVLPGSNLAEALQAIDPEENSDPHLLEGLIDWVMRPADLLELKSPSTTYFLSNPGNAGAWHVEHAPNNPASNQTKRHELPNHSQVVTLTQALNAVTQTIGAELALLNDPEQGFLLRGRGEDIYQVEPSKSQATLLHLISADGKKSVKMLKVRAFRNMLPIQPANAPWKRKYAESGRSER